MSEVLRMTAMTSGPVDIAIVAFPGNQFNGRIAPALVNAVESGVVKIIDLVMVTKDADGNVDALEFSDLAPAARDALDSLGIEGAGLVSDEDVAFAADQLEPNSSAAMIVWENLWAIPLVTEFAESGGQVLGMHRVGAAEVETLRQALAAGVALAEED